jgi:hypothetical protein
MWIAIALLLQVLTLLPNLADGASFRAAPLLIPGSQYYSLSDVRDSRRSTADEHGVQPTAVGVVSAIGAPTAVDRQSQASLPPATNRSAGTTVIVVFITVEQTAGYFYHAFILFFNPGNLDTPHGAYKTEAVGGGSRNIIGVPSLVHPKAPWSVTARGEMASASSQNCHFPAYLFPPWASCTWRNFSIILHTSMSVASLRGSFAQTARCFTVHPVDYHVFGPNSNTYPYTALLNAGIHPGDAPSVVFAPGWGSVINSPCTLH